MRFILLFAAAGCLLVGLGAPYLFGSYAHRGTEAAVRIALDTEAYPDPARRRVAAENALAQGARMLDLLGTSCAILGAGAAGVLLITAFCVERREFPFPSRKDAP